MRTLGVFFFTLIFVGLFFWGCCAFISAVPNPMEWRSEGRFSFVSMTIVLGGGIALGTAAWYDEQYN